MLKIIKDYISRGKEPKIAPFLSDLKKVAKRLEDSDTEKAAEAEAIDLVGKIKLAETGGAKQESFDKIAKIIGAPSSGGTGDGKSKKPGSGGGGPPPPGSGKGPPIPVFKMLTKEEKSVIAHKRRIASVETEYALSEAIFDKLHSDKLTKIRSLKANFDTLTDASDAQDDKDAVTQGKALELTRQPGVELIREAKSLASLAQTPDAKDPSVDYKDIAKDFANFEDQERKLTANLAWLDNADDPGPVRISLQPFSADPAKLSTDLKVAIGEARTAAAKSDFKTGCDEGLKAAGFDKTIRECNRVINSERAKRELVELNRIKSENDKIYIADGKLSPKVVTKASIAMKDDGCAALRKAFDDIRNGRTSLSKDQIDIFYGGIVDQILKVPDNRAILAADNKLAAELLLVADQQGELTKGVLDGLGDQTSAIAAKVVVERAKSNVDPTELDDWMYGAVSKEDWNNRDNGVGAQVFNALWNSGDFDKIAELIGNGVDPGLPHSLGQDTGRGSGDQEGIWSGFIQPLEHLLGNYVYKVAKLDEKPCPYQDEELAKVQGAQKVLAALGDDASILTDYKAIKDSPAMKLFAEKPGTIWGFEDVRLPYVQAAREVEDSKNEKHGNQPLRMWELWKAIEHALNEKGYDELLSDPDTAIPKFVAEGMEAVKDEEIVKNPHAYPDIDVDAFLKEFEKQATTFLRHVSQQIPKGQFDTAEISGMDPGKLMGGLGCKAGLWWAKEQEDPVYYCIDGLNMKEAVDYKAMKNKKIKAHIENGGSKHFEVITFAEIREILKNWTQLEDTVIFIEKGKKIEAKRVAGWITDMEQNDEVAGKRPAPSPEKFKGKLEALGGDLWTKIQSKPYDAMKVTVKADTLLRVAKMAKKSVMADYLEKKCTFLVEYKLIPENLAYAARGLVDADSDGKAVALSKFKGLLFDVVKNFAVPLENWADSV